MAAQYLGALTLLTTQDSLAQCAALSRARDPSLFLFLRLLSRSLFAFFTGGRPFYALARAALALAAPKCPTPSTLQAQARVCTQRYRKKERGIVDIKKIPGAKFGKHHKLQSSPRLLSSVLSRPRGQSILLCLCSHFFSLASPHATLPRESTLSRCGGIPDSTL